jgi:formylmethanofuran dehydrogenase subunit C
MKVTGTVEFVDLEGGFFRLVADDGKRYTLIGSKGALKDARGARVEVEGSIDDGFGIFMAGPQLRVDKLRKL